MPAMPLLAALMLAVLVLAGCQRLSPPLALSPAEEQAVERLGRDRWLDVRSLQRTESGDLVAVTQQGNQRIDYLITIDDAGAASFERLPRVTFGQPR